MRVETWYKIRCDKCNIVNWLCDGDTSDLTQLDINGFICYKCKAAHSFLKDDPVLIEVLGGDDPDSYEVDLEKPSME